MPVLCWTMDFLTARSWRTTRSKGYRKDRGDKGKKETVSYQEDIPAKIVLVKGSKSDVKKQIRIGQVKAPVKKGQVLGYIIYKRGDEVLLKNR